MTIEQAREARISARCPHCDVALFGPIPHAQGCAWRAEQGRLIENGLSLDISADVLAERERCAKIAESHGVHPQLDVYNGGPDWYKHGQEIAARIRSGK